MTLVEHARRELELSGQAASDPGYVDMLVATVAAFVAYGYSGGGSAAAAIDQLDTLLRRRALTPLTSDPDEWEDRSGVSATPLWQSRRDPAAMSGDGGATWYYVDERGRRLAPGPDELAAAPGGAVMGAVERYAVDLVVDGIESHAVADADEVGRLGGEPDPVAAHVAAVNLALRVADTLAARPDVALSLARREGPAAHWPATAADEDGDLSGEAGVSGRATDAVVERYAAGLVVDADPVAAHVAAVNLALARDLVKAQGRDGTWDYSPYMRGMYNGMELVLSLMEGRDPVYRYRPAGGYLQSRSA